MRNALRPICSLAPIIFFGLLGCQENSKTTEKSTETESPSPKSKEDARPPQTPSPHGWTGKDDPRNDGWESEAFAASAQNILKGIATSLIDREAAPPNGLVPTVRFQDRGAAANKREMIPLGSLAISSDPRGGADTSDQITVDGTALLAELRKRFLPPSVSKGRAKFKIVGVERPQKPKGEISTSVVMESFGTAETQLAEHHARFKMGWSRSIETDSPVLTSIELLTHEIATRSSAETLFSDCTVSALSETACFESQFLHGMSDWHRRIAPRYAIDLWGVLGLATGDVNGDGLEDLYVCESRAVPNRLLLQQSDGTLKDASKSWGVAWLEAAQSALLVDFDNDGDQDLAVATIGSVVLASNEGDHFKVRAALPMPQQITHLAATDYDQDGRLDLYAAAYSRNRSLETTEISLNVANDYLDANNGAPNALFRNQIQESNWTFENVTVEAGLDANNRRLSFSASWEDYDNDGDLDLYVANDFGRNNLYRNDGQTEGKPQFTDVASSLGTEDGAFGMSVSWGDYDRNGWMDAYVANMWSAAGKRITTQDRFKPGISEEERAHFLRFARGNTLLRNSANGSKFEDVSERAGVTMGRWAWSSPFLDINNDGWEDILVANGYITGGGSGDL